MRRIRIQKHSLGGYLVGAYLFSVPAFSYSGEMSLNFIPQVLGILVVAFASIDLVKSERLNIPRGIQLYGLFVLWLVFTYCLTGILNGQTGATNSLLTSVKVGFITLGATQLIKTDRGFYNALNIFVLSIIFVAYLNFDRIIYLQQAAEIVGKDRFDGTMANANTAAIYSLSIISASFVLFFKHKSKIYLKLIYGCLTSVGLFIIYFSGSKKGLIGIVLLTFLVVWVFFTKYKHSFFKRTMLLIAGTCLISAAIYFVYSSPFYYRLEYMIKGADEVSTLIRFSMFMDALGIWLENPISFIFGIGHGSYSNLSVFGTYSHSTISEVFVSTGIIGLVIYFSSFIFLLKSLYSLAKLSSKTEYYISVLGCIVFILIMLLFNVGAVMYSSREIWPLLGIVGAYAYSLKRSSIHKSIQYAESNY